MYCSIPYQNLKSREILKKILSVKVTSLYIEGMRLFWGGCISQCCHLSEEYTMIGNEKFEPLTLWNDNELRYRIIASQ